MALTSTCRSRWQSWRGRRRIWGRWWWERPSWRFRNQAGPVGNWMGNYIISSINLIIYALKLHLINFSTRRKESVIRRSWENRRDLIITINRYFSFFLFNQINHHETFQLTCCPGCGGQWSPEVESPWWGKTRWPPPTSSSSSVSLSVACFPGGDGSCLSACCPPGAPPCWTRLHFSVSCSAAWTHQVIISIEFYFIKLLYFFTSIYF